MEQIDRFKAFLVADTIQNPNVVFSELNKLVADLVGDAATFKVVATPAATPGAGAVLINSTVALASTTGDATIRYTTGTSAPADPTATSPIYTGPITIPATGLIIKAKAWKGYQTASNILSATYTITKAATPTATPGAGAVADNSSVVLACATAGSTIYYTVDGSTPDNTKTLYTAPVVITDAVTIKAIAYAPNYAASNVLTAAYTISG